MTEKRFCLPLYLFYQNPKAKKSMRINRTTDNVAMFLKTHLISFSDRFARNWNAADDAQMKDVRFALTVHESLLRQYAKTGQRRNDMISDALGQVQALDEDERAIRIKAHHTASLLEVLPDGSTRSRYHYVEFSPAMVRALSRLFVSTVVYNALKTDWPEENGEKYPPEGMVVRFDMETRSAVICKVDVLSSAPLVPFQRYINEILNQIWDEIERADDETAQKAVDFYTDLKISKAKRWGEWHPVKDLDEALDRGMVAPYGVYMLYNSKKKTFYVGKANEVYKRIDQHRKSKLKNEPMKEFDYYRFSLIDKAHTRMIYLIENAAIHDCAAILNMPYAKTGRLSAISLQGHVTDDLRGVNIVNTDEAQTKWGTKAPKSDATADQASGQEAEED